MPAPRAYVEPTQQPRVELGFRDGTTALLVAGSPHSLELQELAGALTRRD